MGLRRKAREQALQILYQMEMRGGDLRSTLDLYWKSHEEEVASIRDFATQLAEGTLRNLPEIDQLIEKHSTHWRIPRMSLIDRNILRLGVYELLYLHEVPASVTINEAIEIAKKFGTENSGAFINGILDHIAKEVRKGQ